MVPNSLISILDERRGLRNVRNIYPLYTSKAIWDNQRATTLDKRVYILTRSAYIGSQRYGAGSWSGDIRASFDVFNRSRQV